jgi:hypothetical protein
MSFKQKKVINKLFLYVLSQVKSANIDSKLNNIIKGVLMHFSPVKPQGGSAIGGTP